MAHTKRRVRQHIMEDQSYSIFKQLLPEEWAVHEYRPDYGIDLVVELFKYTDEAREAADTLGEVVFVQLKSVKTTEIRRQRVYSRTNVEKSVGGARGRDHKDIEVISFTIDTDELLTVQTMGPTIAVVLCLVCLDTRRVFFVCLNDLVEKILLSEDANYATQATKTIHIPVKNEVTKLEYGVHGLKFLARRPKYYADFNKFHYQQNELWYFFGFQKPMIQTYRNIVEQPRDPERELRPLLRRFIVVLSGLDMWDDNDAWQLVEFYRVKMEELREKVDDAGVSVADITSLAMLLWNGLTALSSTYEEICREWFLPTYLGDELSYPPAAVEAASDEGGGATSAK